MVVEADGVKCWGAHNGRVQVEREHGMGSRFIVILPPAPKNASRRLSAAPASR